MKRQIEPVGKQLLLRYAKPDTEIGGIALPQKKSDYEAKNRGTVLRVGPLVRGFKHGDEVILPRGIATEVELNGIKYMLIDFEQVIARVVESVDPMEGVAFNLPTAIPDTYHMQAE